MGGKDRGRTIGRLLGELAIIFIGVVLAFQFDSCRETSNRATLELNQLQALQLDFESNLDRYEFEVRQQRRVVDYGIDFLMLGTTGASVSDYPPDTLARKFVYAISWYSPETVTGSYDALTGSGDIGIIQNEALQRQLASFYGTVNAGFEDHENQMDVVALMLEEVRGQLAGILAPNPDSNYTWWTTSGADPNALEQVLQNDNFIGLLSWKLLLDRNRLGWLETLHAEADSIHSTLEREIQTRR